MINNTIGDKILHFTGYEVSKHDHQRTQECIELISKVEGQSLNDVLAVLVRLGAEMYCKFFNGMWDSEDDDTFGMIMKYSENDDRFYYENTVEIE